MLWEISLGLLLLLLKMLEMKRRMSGEQENVETEIKTSFFDILTIFMS